MTAYDWEEAAKEVHIAKLPRKVGELVFGVSVADHTSPTGTTWTRDPSSYAKSIV